MRSNKVFLQLFTDSNRKEKRKNHLKFMVFFPIDKNTFLFSRESVENVGIYVFMQ